MDGRDQCFTHCLQTVYRTETTIIYPALYLSKHNFISKFSCRKYCYLTVLDDTTTNYVVTWIYIQ